MKLKSVSAGSISAFFLVFLFNCSAPNTFGTSGTSVDTTEDEEVEEVEIDAGGSESNGGESAEEADAPSEQTQEETTPGMSDTLLACSDAGYANFIINVHDIGYVDDSEYTLSATANSADTILQLVDLFEKYEVRGEFYLTGPIVEQYAQQRPDVIQRLKNSDMTISYHVRPPHPLVGGFDSRLKDKSEEEIASLLMDYETCRLDLETGEADCSREGGYQSVARIFERKPVTVSVVANADPHIVSAAQKVYAALGAKVVVVKETQDGGTDLENPYRYQNGLLVRPLDINATDWGGNGSAKIFWWNVLGTSKADQQDPVAFISDQMAAWEAERAPFVATKIHENNFYRQGAESWSGVYFVDDGVDKSPRTPPYPIDELYALDTSTERTEDYQKMIWEKYEEMIAFAAENLNVVTAEDAASMAELVNDEDFFCP